MSANFYEHLKNKLKIEKLLKHPTIVATIFDSDDAAIVEARKPLVAERNAIKAGKYTKAEVDASQKLAIAAEKRMLARLAFDAANRDEITAYSTANAVSYRAARELADIERELVKTCDPRVWEFYQELDNIFDVVRFGIKYVMTQEQTIYQERRFEDNCDRVHAALAVIAAARADCVELRYVAITRVDLTLRLQGWSNKLAPLLLEFGVKPPIVTSEDCDPAQSPWPAPPAKSRPAFVTMQ